MAQISIVIPCFNCSRTIGTTLNSVMQQSFKDFETIIVDDASDDYSREIIKKFLKDIRFKYFRLNKNYGVVAARNFGISKATSRYIVFLDSDDVWKKSFLSLSFKTHKLYNSGITHSPSIRIYEKDNKFYGKNIFVPEIINHKNILTRNNICLSSAVLDRNLCGKIKFRETRPEDWDLFCRLILDKKLYSNSIGSFEVFSRISKGQRSQNKMKSFFRVFCFLKNDLNLRFLKILKVLAKWIFYNLNLKIKKKYLLVISENQILYKNHNLKN